MGLLDTGFGLRMDFDVQGLGQLQRANQTMQDSLRQMRRAEHEAREAGTLSSAASANRLMRMKETSLGLADNSAALQKARQNQMEYAAKTQATGRTLAAVGAGLIGAGAGGLYFLKGAVEEAVSLEAAVKGVEIAVGGMEPKQVREFSEELSRIGLKLPGTAQDMASAAATLAKSGVQYEELIKSTEAAVGFSAAAGIEMGTAADIMAQTYNVFADSLQKGEFAGLSMGDAMARVSDTLVELGFSGPGTAAQLANITKKAGFAASKLGLTADQMIAYAAAARSSGVAGEVAGTAFSKMFSILTYEPEKAAKSIGVTVEAFKKMTAQEKMFGLLENLQTLEGAGMLDEVAASMKGVAGNSARAKMALGSLMAAFNRDAPKGSQAANQLAYFMDKAQNAIRKGTATEEKMAERAKALGFQMTILKESWDNFRRQLGEHLMPIIAKVTAKLTEWVGVLMGISPEVKKVIAFIILFGSAFMIVGGGAVLAAGLLTMAGGAMMMSLQMMGIQAETTGQAFRAMWTQITLPALMTVALIALAVAAIAGILYALGSAGFFDPLIEAFKKVMTGARLVWKALSGEDLSAADFDMINKLGLMGLIEHLNNAKQAMKSFIKGFSEVGSAENKWNSFNESAEIFWRTIKKSLIPAVRELRGELGMTRDEMEKQKESAEGWGYAFGVAVSFIGEALIGVGKEIASHIRFYTIFLVWFNKIGEGVGKLFEGIFGMAVNFVETFRALWTGEWAKTQEHWDLVWTNFKLVMEATLDIIGAMFLGWIDGLLIAYKDTFINGLERDIDNLMYYFKDAYLKFKDFLGLVDYDAEKAKEKSRRAAPERRRAKIEEETQLGLGKFAERAAAAKTAEAKARIAGEARDYARRNRAKAGASVGFSSDRSAFQDAFGSDMADKIQSDLVGPRNVAPTLKPKAVTPITAAAAAASPFTSITSNLNINLNMDGSLVGKGVTKVQQNEASKKGEIDPINFF